MGLKGGQHGIVGFSSVCVEWYRSFCSVLSRPAELGKFWIAVRVVPVRRIEIEVLSGDGGVERGVGVAALGKDATVLEQVENLRPRHDGEDGEEDGEVELLRRDELPRLLPELEIDEEEGHNGGGAVAVT